MSLPVAESSPLFDRVADVVRRTFRVPPNQAVSRSTVSSDIAGWDSLSHSMLIMNVEAEFAVDLPLDRMYELVDVGELADVVASVVEVTGR